jgi:putative ABC transport system ATP-binding protein
VSTLQLREIVKRYHCADGASIAAVDGVSLTIAPSELVALYGPSGSGKSTLLMIAAGLVAPEHGSVIFDGNDIFSFSPRQAALYRMREVGFVFQAFHLLPGASALENAAIKLLGEGWTLREACAAARPWLERVGLSDRLQQPADHLSMGERQRVAIARALVNEPRLLLADEPTGNLDTQQGGRILGLLRDLCRERELPVLLVTHDPQASAFADRVHTLRDGRLSDGLDIELGTLAF